MSQRAIHKSEIETLEKQGCSADVWETVQVKNNFNPACIRNVHFSGRVTIGRCGQDVERAHGFPAKSGVYNCTIRDCSIGDAVYISDVKLLANYEISDNVIIENVASLCVSGETAFGNGVEIEVLNEAGGREIPIFDRLSAQTAYMLTAYRHDALFIEKLKQMIAVYVGTRTSTRGAIGAEAVIRNCGTIHNVLIGPAARIDGALTLKEGTVGGSIHDPVVIGAGVIAEDFIILSGSAVDSGTMLSKCFVGQGVRMGKGFSAENSAFFANCEGFHSEACSVFAGPYTVTHHRSTLLIAGMFSFYNAGSGTNQSNHMYKLGPVHQGILERGAKTGSFSYLLWPSRVGAFTAVVGKHYANFDTADFPFSYITEEEGKSVLTPGMNLFTVGTSRDSRKWPGRDRRRDPEKLDLIHFDLLNPYVTGKMVRGIEQLRLLYEKTPKEKVFVTCAGIQVRRLMLKSGIKYYELAVKIFLGEQLVRLLSEIEAGFSVENVVSHIVHAGEVDFKWVDLAGLLSPKDRIDELMKAVRNEEIFDLDGVHRHMLDIYNAYDAAVRAWFIRLVEVRYDINRSDVTATHLVQILEDWKESAQKLHNMIIKDAYKEFDSSSKIGFGIDGGPEDRDEDFTAVRGMHKTNSFVTDLQAQSQRIEDTAEKWLSVLS
ncbi:DUF4954 family protein [bacterium]|nr:DUF4954 family protein [bacterium]